MTENGEAPVLEVRGLTKRFGEFTAVDSLSFAVRRGDVYGFLGPNGSGKSTTIRSILGLVRPTEGEVLLFGRSAGGPRGREGVAGFVDSPGFYGYLSARDNLKLLAAADKNGGKPPLEKVLETVGLTERQKDKVKTYSTGMKQRLAIAAALLREPKFLILDEPTNGLDPGGMRDVRALIRGLAGGGLTIFLSSHLLAEIEQLCNRVAVIGHGRLLAEGTLAEVVGGADGRPDHTVYHLVVDEAEAALRVLQSTSPRIEATVPEPKEPDEPEGFPGGEEVRLLVGPGGAGPVIGELVRGGVEVRALVPVFFVAAIQITRRGPDAGEVPFAAQLLDNGLVVPLITLGFATFVLLPLVVAFVAGDSVAGETSAGTLKTLLSRSVGRAELFFSKTAAVAVYCIVAPAVLVGVGLVAGYLAGGFAPLAGPGGAEIGVGRGIALVWSGAGLVAVPLMGLAAFAVLLSVATQNSLGAGVGAVVLVLLLRLASGLGLTGPLEPYLLTNQFEAWLNLTRDPINWEPIVRSLWVSALWAAVSLAIALYVFVRRDVLS